MGTGHGNDGMFGAKEAKEPSTGKKSNQRLGIKMDELKICVKGFMMAGDIKSRCG